MTRELTTLALEKIKPGPKRKEIPDGRVGRLYFIVQPSGKRSWAFRYKFAGKNCKLTIGGYPAIGLKMAREQAGAAKDNVASGIDPGAGKKAAKAAPAPVDDLVERIVAQFISIHAKRQLKASTAHEAGRLLSREIVGPWRGRRLPEIKRHDVHNLLDGIIARGSPVTANRALAWLRNMCSWAVERGLIEASPCAGIRAPAPETPRERVLLDDELAAIWRSVEALGQPYGAFIRMLVLTGARRNEIAGMRWREIDFAARTWTLPRERTKNAREHVVPLADAAVEILKACPRIAGSDFVFTISGRSPVRGFAWIKRRLDETMPEAPPWTLHDLRRTFASGCARLGVPVHVVEKSLNHASGTFRGIVSVYQRHDFADEKRAAFAAWARHVERIVPGETANILPMLRA